MARSPADAAANGLARRPVPDRSGHRQCRGRPAARGAHVPARCRGARHRNRPGSSRWPRSAACSRWPIWHRTRVGRCWRLQDVLPPGALGAAWGFDLGRPGGRPAGGSGPAAGARSPRPRRQPHPGARPGLADRLACGCSAGSAPGAARMAGVSHSRRSPLRSRPGCCRGSQPPGRGQVSSSPTLAVVTGTRGRWLAGLNYAWGYRAAGGVPACGSLDRGPGSSAPAATAEPTCSALRTALARRRQDLLEVTWAKETLDDRAAFLGVLAEGLSMADEPFLEKALDDRRRGGPAGRRRPAHQTARLRGAASGRPSGPPGCSPTGARGSTPWPPTACDSVMERDGVRSRPPRRAPGRELVSCSRSSPTRRCGSGPATWAPARPSRSG